MQLHTVLELCVNGLEEALTSKDKNAWIRAAQSALGMQRFIISYIENEGDTDKACARLMYEAQLLRSDN